jgi:hypothetical protein
MPLTRGQQLTRITLQQLKNIVQQRKHVLIHVSVSTKNPLYVPKQNRILLKCEKCQNQWHTKVYVYLQRQSLSLGCRQCYEMLIKNSNTYDKFPCKKKIHINQPIRKNGMKALRQYFNNGPFGWIQNVKDLKTYLQQDLNSYNEKALTLLIRNEDLISQKVKLKIFFKNGDVCMHHVIPLHAKGSPDKWNIIAVTKEEHYNLHQLRYKVYNERFDLLASYATHSDMLKIQTGKFQKLKTTKNNLLAVRNLPKEILVALQNGMIWTHKDGFLLKIHPNSLQTMQQIKQCLVDCLPEEHKDRKRMMHNQTSVNYLRSLIITTFPLPTSKGLKKQARSAYNFIVQKLPESDTEIDKNKKEFAT